MYTASDKEWEPPPRSGRSSLSAAGGLALAALPVLMLWLGAAPSSFIELVQSSTAAPARLAGRV
jgi:hypothetical protein